jgi:hypothetical protein
LNTIWAKIYALYFFSFSKTTTIKLVKIPLTDLITMTLLTSPYLYLDFRLHLHTTTIITLTRTRTAAQLAPMNTTVCVGIWLLWLLSICDAKSSVLLSFSFNSSYSVSKQRKHWPTVRYISDSVLQTLFTKQFFHNVITSTTFDHL